MNISTGGSHVLLFERDQQLVSLLSSELQLAGYECHTARTAVEVFDAISRLPIRLVLVDLAQAAAARREFWVALDTQRRGRGVQVFTFHCINIAGYGPQDPDEHAQTATADMEVDGMVGLMNLVDAVRARIPGPGSTTNTMPRMSRVPATPPASPMPSAPPPTLNSTAYRNTSPADPQLYQSTVRTSTPSAMNASQTISQQQPQPPFTAPSLDTSNGTANQPTYTDRIRAVLYPNQRSWSSPSGFTPLPDIRSQQDMQRPAPQPPNSGPTNSTTLQRLASGQSDIEGAGESGLAQLSRLLSEYRPPVASEQVSESLRPAPEPLAYPVFPTAQQVSNSQPFMDMPQMPPTPPINQVRADTRSMPAMYADAPPSPQPDTTSNVESPMTMQPLRASPIQDLPEGRMVAGQVSQEISRRSDAYARQAYATPPSQGPSAAQVSSLSSIASAPAQMPPNTPSFHVPTAFPPLQAEAFADQQIPNRQEPAGYTSEEMSPAATLHGIHTTANEAESLVAPNNAMLIDIMESLPPMPPPQAQPPQPAVLNGRATRTLGSVLLAGHLVPESRLEVAQHIQRMLSGVDMNYQLGEILLMFKLLTPDQLLAASLVSYGLITTQQITALGRIRQELHAIGLEYDLENLLILFRMLTPEQIREAKSNH